MRELRIFCDGAYRKRYMGFGFQVMENGKEIYSQSGLREPAEHNSAPRAEALALYAAMDWLKKSGFEADKIRVYSDSQLCVRQLSGEYRINPDTSHGEIIAAVLRLKSEFKNIIFNWIPREGNTRADYLSGFALAKKGIHKT